MPVLAYCITELDPPIDAPKVGVQGSIITSIEESGLLCLVSHFTQQTGTPARDTALAFSRVLQDIFRQTAIIPFSFPTLLRDETEITSFLREHAVQYREALARLRNFVQMEVQINLQQTARKADCTKASGTEYLRGRQLCRQKLASAADQFRRAGQAYVHGWRQRDAGAGIRGYALVDRRTVPAFLEKVGAVSLPSDLRARITGPWPTTEFLKESDGQQEI